jgi:hypothetical protein
MGWRVIENPSEHQHSHRLADVARDFDPTMPPQDILDRYGARLLDPHHAEVMAGHPTVRNTAYVADRLLLPHDHEPAARELVTSAARQIGLETFVDEWATESPHRGCAVVRFAPGDEPVPPPDAWRVLQRARALATHAGASELLRGVGLEHLLFASPGVIGSPYHQGSRTRRGSRRVVAASPAPAGPRGERATPGGAAAVPVADTAPGAGSPGPGVARQAAVPSAPGSDEEVATADPVAGARQDGESPMGLVAEDAPVGSFVQQGDRQPVAWIGPRPMRGMPAVRRPVVTILDNGCGLHPWLDGVVRQDLSIDALPIGYSAPDSDPEKWFDQVGPLDGSADALAGHGTFMAGLVHLACPDADIVAVRVVETDGVVLESVLVDTLAQITELARRHLDGEVGGHPVDVVVLSMGYYHEQPLDDWDQTVLAQTLEKLGEVGVIVVAAAGNDATSRPMYPAAFAPSADGRTGSWARPDRVPLVSVGASNPGGGSAAMFSNSAPWVRAWEPGASLVSTMPITFHGGLPPSARTLDPNRHIRESIDPDDYSPGFAVWSGTSFAAPVLGGKFAAALLDASAVGGPSQDQETRATSVDRAWDAVTRLTSISRE